MIKRFSDHGKKRESLKVRRAKLVLSSVKGIENEITSTDKVINRVYASFQDINREFTDTQIKKVVVAFSKMDKSLNKMARKSYLNLKAAFAEEFPTDRIASQIEDIASLRAKLAILRGQAAASLGYDGADELDEEMLEIDEAGYNAEDIMEEDEEDEEGEISAKGSPEDTDVTPPVQPSAEPSEKPISGAEASTEGSPEVQDDLDEEDEENMEELGDQIELEDYEIDDAIGDEILPDTEEDEEDEELEGELSASASLKSKKVASSKKQSGGVELADENAVLSSIFKELEN